MDLISDAQPTDRVDCTGLRFNCKSTTPVYASNVVGDQRDRHQRVTEGAIEVDIPLLVDFGDRSFAERQWRGPLHPL